MKQTSLLLLAMAGVALFAGWAPAHLVTLPEMGLSVQPWRMVTGHFAHSDLQHWLMNGAGLLACGYLFERWCGRHFCGLLVMGIVFVTAWLIGLSSLSAYCGLSGALNAVFVGGCLMRYGNDHSWTRLSPWRNMWLALPILDLAKIIVEASIGNALFSHGSWPPSPMAHLAGWLAGAGYVGGMQVIRLLAAPHSPRTVGGVSEGLS